MLTERGLIGWDKEVTGGLAQRSLLERVMTFFVFRGACNS
jgi:hypothetical protein